MSEQGLPAPMRARFLTPGTLVVLAIAVVGIGVYLARMALGLQAVTNLSDQYPWGIWISIDVASGVALAAGGFTSSALVYIFGHEKYHPLIRPALLTALLGYTFVGVGLMADLGRYYNVWHPIMPSMWQGNSVLFEVGMCVMIYLTVLYTEFVPIAVERFKGRVALPGPLSGLNKLVESVLGIADSTLDRVMGLFIVAGVVLSCLHQSSLGTLMLIAPTKMHALWYTPIMPALFLMSAMAVGFPMIIFEGLIAARSFKLRPELHLYTGLGRIVPFLLGIYGIAKVTDLTIREVWPAAFDGSFAADAFLLELLGGVLLPFCLFLIPRVRRSPTGLFVAATCVVFGVALNRVNVFLVAYKPPFAARSYFPSIFEILVTVGLIATLVLVYRAVVMIFPVITSVEPARSEAATAPAGTNVNARRAAENAP
jgi:Ni/Fe-hydrogenase subunit HybB-like protein